MHYGRLIRQFLGLVLRRPALLPPLLSSAWTFRRRAWYRTPPFLPLPPADYLAWRMHTAYGTEDATPPSDDLARYVLWARQLRRGAGRHGSR